MKNPNELNRLVATRLSADMYRSLDVYRRDQGAIPSRAEAIRSLVRAGLAKHNLAGPLSKKPASATAECIAAGL